MITIKPMPSNWTGWTAIRPGEDYGLFLDKSYAPVLFILAPGERPTNDIPKENYSLTQWSLIPLQIERDAEFAKFPKFDTVEAAIAFVRMLPRDYY